jgi:hypothetical protein
MGSKGKHTMKRVVFCLAVIAAMATAAVAQKINTESGDRTRIVHLKTALNHLTVIEVSEPVTQVATGSASFKVEWRDNKVFVQPTEPDAATNLFIWTASQRLNYELEPAASVTAMDFAVDQAPAPTASPKPARAAAPDPAPSSITELLLAGTPVRLQPSKQRTNKPVEVWISDLYEKDGRVVIRYAMRNHSAQPYSMNTPEVYQLNGVRSPESLYGMVNSQLGEQQVAKLKVKQQSPVRVLEGQVQSSQIAPGQEAVGVVALELASSTQPTVLRLQFANPEQTEDGQHATIAAFLVR